MILARIFVVISELVAEIILLGLLLALVLAPTNLGAASVGSLPVILVLFLNGYYFTRPVLGLVWRSARRWPYGLIAAALFTIHMSVGYARLKPDMTQVGVWAVLTFFIGGATIVFVCAVSGHLWLARKAGTAKIPS